MFTNVGCIMRIVCIVLHDYQDSELQAAVTAKQRYDELEYVKQLVPVQAALAENHANTTAKQFAYGLFESFEDSPQQMVFNAAQLVMERLLKTAENPDERNYRRAKAAQIVHDIWGLGDLSPSWETEYERQVLHGFNNRAEKVLREIKPSTAQPLKDDR